jgi:NADH-quinone oxidoreductase subunit F
MTNIKGVFAGGDAATGPATVIEAVKAGKIAADSIEAYINGVEFRRTYRVTRPGVFIEPVTVEEEFNIKHVEMKKIPVRKRKAGFAEVELTYDEETARKEAKRCLRCDVEVHKEEESKKLKVKSEKHLE